METPASHADLLDRPLPAALTTLLGAGRLQSSVVWFWRDQDVVRFTTMTEFVKTRNLRERPRATLLVWDADGRWLELRCSAEEVRQPPEEALRECDEVGFRYCGVRPYFGAVVPAVWAETEHPVTFRFTPEVVTAGSIGLDEPAPVRAAGTAAAGPAPDARTTLPAEGAALPADHLDLLTGTAIRLLATRDHQGAARVHPVGCDLVGGRPVVRPTSEQAEDLARDLRATLLVVDPAETARWMEVRADTAPADDGCVVLVPRRVVVDAIHP